jgi:hypothetical protein
MSKLTVLVLFLFLPVAVFADDDDELVPCKFTGHTNAGTVSGTCNTQQRLLPQYHARWAAILEFDAKSTAVAQQLKNDQFADMVRTQAIDDGSDVVVLSLWGDLKLDSVTEEYIELIQSVAPISETRPNFITVTRTKDSPLTIEVLFEEPDYCLDLVTRQPSSIWWTAYWSSYPRLSTNRTDGFSSSDGGGGVSKPHAEGPMPPKKRRPNAIVRK